MQQLISKRYLHHLWTRIRPVKTWYLLVAGLICLVIGVFALRANNLQMIELRGAVYQADENAGDVEQALQELRAYVAAHMNTELSGSNGVYPPVQLKHTYERLRLAERQRVDTVNSKVYTDAQAHCEALHPGSFSGGPRVPCIEQYVKDHGMTATQIPDAQYKFDFVSPRWSPDLAGWSVAMGIVLLLLTALRLVAGRLVRRM